jgi:hypothetical protein
MPFIELKYYISTYNKLTSVPLMYVKLQRTRFKNMHGLVQWCQPEVRIPRGYAKTS